MAPRAAATSTPVNLNSIKISILVASLGDRLAERNVVVVNFTLERLVVYDVHEPELGALFFSDVLYSELERALNLHSSNRSSFVYQLRLEADARDSSVLRNATLDTATTIDWLSRAWNSVLCCKSLIGPYVMVTRSVDAAKI